MRVLAVLLAPLAFLLAADGARANVPFQQISSAGPLAEIFVGNDLSCQTLPAGDIEFSFYPPDVAPGDCGTFAEIGEAVYSPDFANHDSTAASNPSWVPWTPVAQTPVSGSGSAGDPYKVTTTVTAAGTGVSLIEQVTYVVGRDSASIRSTLVNNNPSPIAARIYHAADCYLAGTDVGYGAIDAATGGVYCTATPNNNPPDRVIGFVPENPAGTHVLEDSYFSVWSSINGIGNLPDICDCLSEIDNGAALQWNVTIPGSVGGTPGAVTVNGASVSDIDSTPPPTPPTPQPPPPPTAALPTPEAGRTANVERVSGTVRTKCKGESSFSPLVDPEQVTVGCLIDTRNGRVRLTTAKGTAGGTKTAEFYKGLFRIEQQAEKKAETTLVLAESLRCGKRSGRAIAIAAGKQGKKRRGLWGNGGGGHTTRGNNGAAAVRGTVWFVGDRCDSTTVKVKEGKVRFRDFIKKKTVTVRAGESYVAKRR